MIRLLAALAIAVALSFFEFGWRVDPSALPFGYAQGSLRASLPPLPQAAPHGSATLTTSLHAASEADVECVEWAKAGPWTITRCEDWAAGEVCFMANSGMMDCKFE